VGTLFICTYCSKICLSIGSCILAKGGKDAEGNDIVRPYTPVTSNNIWGRFSLIIKIYPDGAFGKYISNCRVGDEVEFKQIPINVKIQYPFGKKKYYGMLVGGTGITPMVQALHALLGNEKDTSQINMLLGNQTEDDILCDKVLKSWTLTHGEQFDVTHVLSSEPEDSTWTGERGFITKELIEKHFASPTEDVLIFVCGPPQMYDAFCGPRDERDKLSGILSDMGYSVDQVYKF